MRLDDETRTRLFVDVDLSVDPAGSSVELSIDGTWHACEWQDIAVKTTQRIKGRNVDVWTQTARTSGYFAGPAATADGATVLTVGRHLTQTRVAWTGGDTLVEPSTPIDVT